jgi:hypothetical protein
MRDVADQINELLREATRAADILSEMSGTSVEYADVLDALVDVLELQSQTELLGDGLNAEAIAKQLSTYDFNRLHPKLIGEVFLDHSILPERVAQRLVEVTVKAHGQVWRIHQNDADPFPSNPHAHNLQTGLKLNLETGELFLGRKKQQERISAKDLRFINDEIARKFGRRATRNA